MTDVTVALRIQASVDQARAALRGTGKDLDGVADSAKRADGALASTASTAQQQRFEGLGESVRGVRSAILAVTAAMGAAAGVKGLFGLADQATLLTARLKTATEASGGFAQANDQIYAISQRLQIPLAGTLQLYQRLAPVVRDLGGAQYQVGQIVEGVTSALKVNGATTEEAASTLLQFSQALGSGKLSGDEFRALSEASPRLMRAIADSIGVPIGALKTLSAQGKLTSDVVANAVIRASSQLRAEAALIPPTVAGAFTNLEGAALRYTQQSQGAATSSRALAGVVQGLADNFGTLANAAAVAGVAVAGALAGRAVNAVGKGVGELLSAQAKSAAEAQAKVAEANAALALARANQVETASKIANVQATEAEIVAQRASVAGRLAQANATIAATRVVVANAQSTIASTSATIAAAEGAGALAYAQRVASAATAERAVAENRLTAASVTLAAAEAQRSAQVTALAALGQRQAAVQAELAAANALAAKSAANLATATTGMAAATTAAAGAGGGLLTVGRSILGLLGGPAGLVITLGLGAAAWLLFRERTDDATEALGRFEDARTKQIQKQIEDARLAKQGGTSTDENRARDHLAKLRAQLDALPDTSGVNPEFSTGDFAREKLQRQIDDLEQVLALKTARDQTEAEGARLDERNAKRLQVSRETLQSQISQDLKTRNEIIQEFAQRKEKIERAYFGEGSTPAEQAIGREKLAAAEKDRNSALKGLIDKSGDDLANARRAAAEKAAQAELAVIKAGLDSSARQNQQAYDEGKQSLADYLASRRALIEAEADAEVRELSRQIGGLKNTRYGDPAKEIERKSQIAELQIKLVLSAAAKAQALADLDQLARKAERDILTLTAKIRVDVAGMTGKFDAAAVRAQLEEQYRSEREKAGTISDPTERAAALARIDLLIQTAAAQAQFNAKLAEAQVLQARLQETESVINFERSTGQISQITAEERIKRAREAQIPALRAILAQLVAIKALLPEESAKAVEEASDAIRKLGDQVTQTTPVVATFSQQFRVSVEDRVMSAIDRASLSIKGFRQAFGQALKEIAADLIKAPIKALLRDIFASDSSGGGGIWGAVWQGVKAIFGFSGGGHVRGPGSATSDSIPARLSDGEFVQPTRVVQHYGLGFMESLRRMEVPRPAFAFGGLVRAHRTAQAANARRFADGGLASGGTGISDMKIELVNKGTPAKVTDATSRFDGQRWITTVFLEDLAVNGPMARGLRAASARG